MLPTICQAGRFLCRVGQARKASRPTTGTSHPVEDGGPALASRACPTLRGVALLVGDPSGSLARGIGYRRSETAEKTRAAKKIVVIAHRGAHREAPENTLASLEKAIQIGCDYVEIDVRRTKDGALVIMHDNHVARMTNGKGKIEDLTLAEIRKFDVKSRKGFAGPVQKVPTFDEILDHAKGRMKIYLDHKQAPPAEVLAAIDRHGMRQDIVVYGRRSVLEEYKKLAPDIWIMPGHPDTIAAIEQLCRELKPETLDGNIVEWTAISSAGGPPQRCPGLGRQPLKSRQRSGHQSGRRDGRRRHPDRRPGRGAADLKCDGTAGPRSTKSE